MDTESERIFERMTLHCLLSQQPDWSDQRTAEEMGKSESWVRKWRHRLGEVTHQHFGMYLSHSRAPKTIWR